MMDMSCHEFFEEKLYRELDILKKKYEQNPGAELAIQDVDKLDKIYHALKCMETFYSMKGYSDGYPDDGMSGRRGRAMNGRYVSRGEGPDYDGYSGHYAPTPYYEPRWR